MNDDSALLRRYVENGSQDAFAELVRRNLDLVYGAALRRTGGDPHRSADIAQEVFTSLARRAKGLRNHAVLASWLHTATRNAAVNIMISEQRRNLRELQASVSAAALAEGTEPVWEKLRPVLDAAIDELPDSDRTVVILRFLERQSFSKVGTALDVTADAARMRTERALDKLRLRLMRRGITSTSAALATAVMGQPTISAPVGLAASVVAESLAGGATGVAGIALFTSLMKTKIVAVSVLIALLIFWAGIRIGQNRMASATPTTSEVSTQETAPKPKSREDNNIKPGGNSATAAIAQSESTVRSAIVQNLRQISAAIQQFTLENRRPPTSILELVGPGKIIKRLIQVDGEDYSTISMANEQPLVVTTTGGVTASYDPSAPRVPMSGEAYRSALQQKYPFLTPDTISKLQPILADYEQRVAKFGQIGQAGLRVLLPEDQQKIGDLKAEQHQLIAAILSPDELLEYDLHTDETAMVLRSRSKLFAPTDDEFRTIYRLQKAFDAQYGSDPSAGPMSGGRGDGQVQRAAHLPELQAQIAAAFGSDRAEEYRLTTQAGAAQFADLASRLQLPSEAMHEVLKAQAEFADGLAAVRADRSIDAQTRAQQSAALLADKTQRVTSILGPDGVEAYKVNGGTWLTMRFRGQ